MALQEVPAPLMVRMALQALLAAELLWSLGILLI